MIWPHRFYSLSAWVSYCPNRRLANALSDVMDVARTKSGLRALLWVDRVGQGAILLASVPFASAPSYQRLRDAPGVFLATSSALANAWTLIHMPQSHRS